VARGRGSDFGAGHGHVAGTRSCEAALAAAPGTRESRLRRKTGSRIAQNCRVPVMVHEEPETPRLSLAMRT